MKILALDPATKMGWAHSSGQAGTWNFSVKRDESAGFRLLRLRQALDRTKVGLGVDCVVFEAARHAGAQMQGALVVQAELQGVIKCWCEENRIMYRGYSPTEIKKFATGKGNANKAAMAEAAAIKWPGITGDDNEIDARWLLELFKQQQNIK